MSKKKKIVRPHYIPKEQRMKAERKPLSRNAWIAIIASAAVLIAAIVLFAILYDDGSLPVKDGAVVTTGDNWMILNTASSGKKYYKIGEIGEVEGFTRDTAESYATDTNETDFFFKPNDEASPLTQIYVRAVKLPPAEIAATAQASIGSLNALESISEVKTATVAGMEATYFYAVYAATEATSSAAATERSEQMTLYLPAPNNRSVLISLSAGLAEGEGLGEEGFLAVAETIGNAITFETK